ncbi:MAG TPA: flagellar hook-basal body complex protein [Buchnera sp. (in: enterobacteria)]|nr:flagellar hook-basal body complex protein [Buchnera sp. (in: enterobacteria)]
MEQVIYTSMLAANKILDKQAITANNLANISTIGFKEQLLSQLSLPVNNSKLFKNKYKIPEDNYPYSNFSSGPINHTQRDLDLSIPGNGWFVIRDKYSKNKEGYTRNGHLKITTDGKLMINHYLVVGKSGVISLPKNKNIYVSTSGIINLTNFNREKLNNNSIDKLKLVNPDPKYLIRGNNGIFYLNEQGLKKWKNTIPDDKEIKLTSGTLEDSNVNINENLINLIAHEKHFSIEMKIISDCDQNIQRANQLLNINN